MVYKKQNVLKLLVVATLDPCLGWLTSHNFPAPKTSRINSSDPKRSCNLSQYISRHFACDVSRQRLNLMLDNVLVLSHCNRVHNIIQTAQICKVTMCKDVWLNLGCSLSNFFKLRSQLRVCFYSSCWPFTCYTISLSQDPLSQGFLCQGPLSDASSSLKVLCQGNSISKSLKVIQGFSKPSNVSRVKSRKKFN